MKPMKIKEFAQNIGVTPELIKYYESQNIIHPFIDETNGYRYFTIQHTREIYEAEKYRNLGYSIKDAEKLIHSTSILDLHTNLEEKKKELEIQALLLSYQQKELTNQIQLIDDYLHNNIYVIKSPGFYILPHTKLHSFINMNNPHMAALKDWHEFFPIVKQATIRSLPIDIYNINSWKDTLYYHGFIIEENAYKDLKLNIDYAIYIPPRRCIKRVNAIQRNKIFKTIEERNKYNEQFVDSIFESLLDKDIKICGDIVTIFNFFATIDNTSKNVYETYIPIR